MLFIPYALHDRDAYARTAREKFESLGKAGPAAAATPAVPGLPGRQREREQSAGTERPGAAASGRSAPRGHHRAHGRGRAAAVRAARASEQQESAADFCLQGDVLEASRRNPAANTSTHSREEDFIPNYSVTSFYPS